jgi:prevent-host-death family protein
MKVSVYEAKSKLSQMINKALAGEEVVITRNGEATVKLVPAVETKSNWMGSMRGKIVVHDSFFDPLDHETVKYLNGELSTPFPE